MLLVSYEDTVRSLIYDFSMDIYKAFEDLKIVQKSNDKSSHFTLIEPSLCSFLLAP